jgi:hypothetical protein
MEKRKDPIDIPTYDQCCESGSGAFLPPGSGMNFFPGWVFFLTFDTCSAYPRLRLTPVLRIRDPVLFYPLDPTSGSGMNFFRIRDELFPDPGWIFFPDPESQIFFTLNKTKTLLLKAWEASKKISLHSTFHVRSRIRDKKKMFGSGSGMRKWSDPG